MKGNTTLAGGLDCLRMAEQGPGQQVLCLLCLLVSHSHPPPVSRVGSSFVANLLLAISERKKPQV